MIGTLILWGCIIWIVPLMYVLLRNEAKWKKNIVVGATLPYEARQDPEVEETLRRYQRQLGWMSVLLLLVTVPCMFVPQFSVQFILWSFWLLLAMVLLQIPFVRTNKALRRIKVERGWRRQPSAQAVSDLTAAAVPMKWLSPWWFLPPLVLSLIPMALDRELWVMWLMDAALVAFCYVGYRWLFRLRAEVVDANTDLTVALTHLRRYNWGKTWLWIAWATGCFNLGLCLTLEWFWAAMAVTFVYGAVVVVATIGIEFRVRRAQERLTADSGKDFYVDEDDQWIWGMFYYNPNDKRLVVNNRTGINTTFNLARRGGPDLYGPYGADAAGSAAGGGVAYARGDHPGGADGDGDSGGGPPQRHGVRGVAVGHRERGAPDGAACLQPGSGHRPGERQQGAVQERRVGPLHLLH